MKIRLLRRARRELDEEHNPRKAYKTIKEAILASKCPCDIAPYWCMIEDIYDVESGAELTYQEWVDTVARMIAGAYRVHEMGY